MKRLTFAVIVILAFATYAIQTVGQTSISTGGVIESKSGGFKFPDGSVQLSAVSPPCTAITSLPFVISSEGVYCFAGNLETSMTSGSAIEIQTDNVVIDLNGWKLDGLGAGPTTSTLGISGEDQSNIIVRNGTISGFLVGISLGAEAIPYTSRNHLIEHILADQNRYSALSIFGSGIVVRHNQVTDTGPTSLDATRAVFVGGIDVRFIDNDITGTVATSDAVGLMLWSTEGAVLEDNRIGSVTSGTSDNHGIEIYNSTDALLVGNRITNVDYGISFGESTGKYRDNLTFNVTTPFTGGTDAGGND